MRRIYLVLILAGITALSACIEEFYWPGCPDFDAAGGNGGEGGNVGGGGGAGGSDGGGGAGGSRPKCTAPAERPEE